MSDSNRKIQDLLVAKEKLEKELEIVTSDRNGVMRINVHHRERIAELEAKVDSLVAGHFKMHVRDFEQQIVKAEKHGAEIMIRLINDNLDAPWVNEVVRVWLERYDQQRELNNNERVVDVNCEATNKKPRLKVIYE